MTMAWTAPTRLGPRTVALSLKVFIVVMFYTHERLGICTAQPGNVLPEALQENLSALIGHFCQFGCVAETIRLNNCGHAQQLPKPLCRQICNNGSCNANCWETDGVSRCKGNQIKICGYSNADVCRDRNEARTRICVYTTYSSPAFCICKPNPRTGLTQYTTRICNPPATTTLATTERATTAQAITTQVITTQDITAHATAAHSSMTNQPVNVVGIVFGSLFALLLLFLVVTGAVMLHRQGRLMSIMKQTTNPVGFSSVDMEARDSTRALTPEPPVPGSSIEYSTAYDHMPARLGATAPSYQEDPTYCSIGEDGPRKGKPRYVLDWEMKMRATKELDTSHSKDPSYFVLNRNEGADEVGSESEGGHADGDEVTDSSTGVRAKEVIDKENTPLVPSEEPRSRTEQYEVAVSPTSSPKPSPIDAPIKGLSNGDDGTYFPLILSAPPKSPLEQSGYEDAKIPPLVSHDSISPTAAQSISCDDNTYTLLVRTAEPKSQKERSEYEVPNIPKPDLAANGDVTPPCDDLDRESEKEPKEGALSAADLDDYQQLVITK